jgi:hypothetical protein
MLRSERFKGFVFLSLIVVLLGACAPAATPTAAAPSEPPAATAAPTLASTPTAAPTQPVPTALPSPTATLPAATAVPPLAISADGFSAWCRPQGLANPQEPWFMPTGGKTFTKIYGIDALIVPAVSCTFIFTFNQPVTEGVQLEVYDKRAAPWLVTDLIPVADTNVAYVTLNNPYIVEPPFWQITYTMAVRDASGQEIWNREVTFDRGYRPELCWDGTLPNAVTMRCRWEKELHPWDPEYRTPAPEN